MLFWQVGIIFPINILFVQCIQYTTNQTQDTYPIYLFTSLHLSLFTYIFNSSRKNPKVQSKCI